ncbi:MAG: hypothetical protein PW792_07115 [Acidobacteriaceae bacterium]|nr:hypothetical protein [Acidobacteriaceae bacterium]
MQEAALAVARREVTAAEERLLALRLKRDSWQREGRSELQEGRCEEWRVAEGSSVLTEMQDAVLQQILQDRKAQEASALEVLLLRKVATEQVVMIDEKMREALKKEGERREQNVSDDRFAARTFWADHRERVAEL